MEGIANDFLAISGGIDLLVIYRYIRKLTQKKVINLTWERR